MKFPDLHHDADGITPLHLAARDNHTVEVLQYLIERCDDVNVKDGEGRTPLDVAGTETYKEMLRAAGGKSGKEL